MRSLSLRATVAAVALAASLCHAQPATRPVAAAPDPRLIILSTRNSALTLFRASDNRLYQLAYASSANTPAIPNNIPRRGGDRLADRQTEYYPSFGNGYLSEPALQVTHADGNTSTDLLYVSHATTDISPGVKHTKIELKDPAYPFFVTLNIRAYADTDVLEQWTDIRHDEPGPVVLHRFASASPVFAAREFHLTQFAGYHSREAIMHEERLTPGVKLLDTKLGVRAHQTRPPFFLLSVEGKSDETTGEVIGGQLSWVGNFAFTFDLNWNNLLRVVAGINPFASQYRLPAGQTFTTPALVTTWSNAGRGQVSRNLHRWVRAHSLRDADRPRPALLNNWEATFFSFDEKKLVSLMDGAREIGAELFLLDDGWFGDKYPRNDDHQGLGDWMTNRAKLPNGLGHLVKAAKERGIEFGIWLEPEMVSPKSELYEAHPDWVMTQKGRDLITGRYQAILDLTRPEVQAYVMKIFDDTLKEAAGTTYIKWDCNTYALQPGSSHLPADAQSHLLIDYQRAVYDAMEKLHRNHPNVMTMLCSSGPSRADYGSLKHFHSMWASDNTDPARRIFIQHGFSFYLPAQAVSAHVTRSGNHSMKFTTDVALSTAAFGMDLDLSKLSAQDKQFLAGAIQLYKDTLRPLITTADLYRLESPYDGPRSSLMFVSPDQSKAILFAYRLPGAADRGQGPVRLQGLNPAKTYRITEANLPQGAASQLQAHNTSLTGASLASQGLTPPLTGEYQSTVILLTAE